MNQQPKDDSARGLDGVLGAIEKLVKLANALENAQHELHREGEIDFGKHAKATYRFRVRTLGDLKRDVERKPSTSDFKPFEKSATSKSAKVTPSHVPKHTAIEPETDVFIEHDSVAIYAQLPGISESDISIDAHADRLVLRAESKSFLYQKNVPLPARVQPETLVKSYHNGILEVRLTIQPNA